MQRLLLVSDHFAFRQGLALLLESHTGLGSHEAASLAEAKRILNGTNDKPACVVVCVDMPEGEGIEVLEHLSELPVVALTTGPDLQRRAQALKAGADEVLPLSVSADRIADAVRRLAYG